jgi:hypothetical protein
VLRIYCRVRPTYSYSSETRKKKKKEGEESVGREKKREKTVRGFQDITTSIK